MSAIIIPERVRSEDQNILSIADHGEFEVVFTYMDDDEPVMLLRPKRFIESRRCCFGIALDGAYKYYDKSKGEAMHSDYAVAIAPQIAQRLGLTDDVSTRFALLEAILESIDTLHKIPPRTKKADGDQVQGTVRIGEQEFAIDTVMEGEKQNSTDHMTKVDNLNEILIQ